MIVRDGRKYIIENGLNPANSQQLFPGIIGFFYGNVPGNTDSTSDSDYSLIVREDDELHKLDDSYYLAITRDENDNESGISGTDVFLVARNVNNMSIEKVDDLTYEIKVSLQSAEWSINEVTAINTFGLITGSINEPKIFSRITFPTYSIKNSSKVELTYYLYF